MAAVPRDPPAFSVVLPVKVPARAKTRLALPGPQRAELALAMALDTVAAVASAACVRFVLAVCDDPGASRQLAAAGATVVPDRPNAGLDAALTHGAAEAGREWPTLSVAALAADLPGLRAAELDAALWAAAGHDRAVVADAAGSGTTLLTAVPPATLAPAFGAGSLNRHAAAGATVLDVPAASGLRRDVDTLEDLWAVAALGVGVHTAALLAQLAPSTPPVRYGTVAAADPSGGEVLLDDGSVATFSRAALARSPARRLRAGQRVRVDVAGDGTVQLVTPPTLPPC
jgi:2-phospho-L-lactate guanylyltransferase